MFTVPANCPCESREIGEAWKPCKVAFKQVFEKAERRGAEYFFDLPDGRELRCLAALVGNDRSINPKERLEQKKKATFHRGYRSGVV